VEIPSETSRNSTVTRAGDSECRVTELRVFNSTVYRSFHDNMSLLESSSLSTTSTSIQSAQLSAKEYVLSLASLPNYYAASASAPTNSIYVFDKSSLQNVRTLPGQETAITSLRTINTYAGLSRPLLAWSGKDGVVNVWDDRTASVNIKSKSRDCIPMVIKITRFFDDLKDLYLI